jgi:hypothetical protein
MKALGHDVDTKAEQLLDKTIELEQIAFAMMALLPLAARDNPAVGNGGLPQGLRVIRLEYQLSSNSL